MRPSRFAVVAWALRRALRAVLLTLAAIVLFIEEWGWRPLTAAMARLAQWPPLGALEARVRTCSPRVALVLFLVPAVLLFPLKLLALGLIHQGHTALGIGTIIASKLVGTAIVGRLFILTEPQLTQYAWFARALRWWRDTQVRVKAAIRRSATWQAAQALQRALRTRVRVLRRRWARVLSR